MKKTLVAFFSASGTTKKIAEMIAEAANADLHEIAPKVLYTKDDLNWMNKKSRSSVEIGKKIVLFATSGGSGFGNTVKELQPSVPGTEIVEGKLFLTMMYYLERTGTTRTLM